MPYCEYRQTISRACAYSLKCPGILPPDLLLLLRCEVILYVESFPDFLGGLALDHVSHCLTCEIKQALNIQVIGSLYQKGRRQLKSKHLQSYITYHSMILFHREIETKQTKE